MKPNPIKKQPLPNVIPGNIRDHFEVCVGVMPRFVCAEFGDVDLSTVTIEFAERLAIAGYLKKLVLAE